ncbi:DNA topoisomerase 1 [Ceratobasidium sp. AG-Ba]|nr:DNA topoisomerase 1 [Ceratobasidium sp. AG-Ba]
MKVLCVAEKPSIAKSVAQILSGGRYETRNTQSPYHKNFDFHYAQTGDDYTMTAVSGHLTEKDFGAALRSWHACDPFQLFDAPIETRVSKDGERIERNLLSEARRAQMLVIWTDCDREGENIGVEIETVCLRANPRIRVKRARFSAIIPAQIHRAAQNPVDLDRAQSDAVEARILLDLRFGAAFTRMQTLTLQPRFPQLEQGLISYGPCQFPTLGFVVSRYEQVKAFVPEPFWYIYLSIIPPDASDGEETNFSWRRNHIFEFDVAMTLYEGTVEHPTARVTKVTKKPTKKWKPLPLTTVELQKAASRLLHLAPKKALDIAEKLYQDGFLSYPRTETDQFDPAFDFDSLIAKQTVDPEWGAFATNLQNGGFQRPRDGKKNDKAHPPIHPTAHAANLQPDAKRVYEYVTRRFLACCSKDAEGFQTTVDVVVNEEEFFATGLVVLERNYLEVYKYDKWTGKNLPDFEEGQEFMPSVCELRDGETTSPALLTEADLVTLMDKNGIGTDATIAQHIQTIIDRQYVIARQEGATKYLVPSTLGIGLIEGYNRIGFDKSLSKPLLRRETERMMVQVCERQASKLEIMARSIEQYKDVFVRARQQFHLIIESVGQHINNQQGGIEGLPVNNRGGNGDDGGPRGRGRGRGGGRGGGAAGRGNRGQPGDGPDSDSDGGDNGGGRGRGRRGAVRGSRGGAAASPVARRGRGAKAPAAQPTAASRPPGQTNSMNRTSNSMRQESTCQCGTPAAERTVTKDGANKGRKFLTCGKERTCDFFEWLDDASGSGSVNTSASTLKPSATIPAKRKSSEMTASDNDRRCNCKLTAVQRTVQKEGPNKGRTFWAFKLVGRAPSPELSHKTPMFKAVVSSAANQDTGATLVQTRVTTLQSKPETRVVVALKEVASSVGNPDTGATPVQTETLGQAQPGAVVEEEAAGPSLVAAEGAEGEDRSPILEQPTITDTLYYLYSYSSSSSFSQPTLTSSNSTFNSTWGPISAQGGRVDVARHAEYWRIPGGRLEVNLEGVHPFYNLIARAESTWNNMLESQSTTLDAAIKEYRHRYNRQPPIGFDKWFEFAQSVDFKLIDEFDQIDRDITPLLALPRSVLEQRLKSASKEPHSYQLTIKKGNVTVAGPLSRWDVSSKMQKLVSAFAKDLSDMTIFVSGHDSGPAILAEDMRIAVDAVLKHGRRFSEEQLEELENVERNPRRGVTNACLEDPLTLPQQNRHGHTFIYDHRASMSFCKNPAIIGNPLKRHGYFAYDVSHSNQATPYFVQSQTSAGGALLHPALQSYSTPEEYLRKYGEMTKWSDRASKVFWRGRTTGEWFNKQHDWRYSHRTRLHLMTNEHNPAIDSGIPREVELLVDVDGRGLRLDRFARNLLNEKYMDVTLVGPQAVQCEDQTCQDMNAALNWGKETGWSEGLNNKYLLDIDGNAWSSRFQRLLSSGAAILKMTLFPEWNSDWLIPYYHYIPIQTDYSDLYDSIAFFAGIPGGPPGQDKLAESIGAHGHEFAVRYWRWEDMQVYVYRLLLEYARLISEGIDEKATP